MNNESTLPIAPVEAIPSTTASCSGPAIKVATAGVLLLILTLGAWQLFDGSSQSRKLALSLLLGAAFGIALQRSRFCFYCIANDYFVRRDGRGVAGVLLALLLGVIGYTLIFTLFLPRTDTGNLPPTAHIGPVSIVTVLAGVVFALGMRLSGSCISAHLYRLGEGAWLSLFALGGAVIGFGLGFLSWTPLYLWAIAEAKPLWIPHVTGYGVGVLAQGAVLVAAIVWVLWRSATQSSPSPVTQQPPLAAATQAIFVSRWPTWLGGLAVAAIGTLAYLLVAPLGVTAFLGGVSRQLFSSAGLLPERLPGLDALRGCATAIEGLWPSLNGVFILGLVLASLAAATLAGQWQPDRFDLRRAAQKTLGGILLGWASMTAIGCTVGTLLSGISAGAVAGWVFAISIWLTLWLVRPRR